MLQQILFQGWEPIVRTGVSTSLAYLVLIILLRVAGPRVLAKWYAFDLIVTVALGSSFANTVLSKNTAVAEAVVGFMLLIGLQFVISWIVLRWSPMRVIVNPNPTLILHNGKFQDEAMRRQRVAEADVRAAVRQHGFASLDGIGGIILEADGTFSVIKEMSDSCSALADVPQLGGSNEANRPRD
jgi:uncharacterized membrane protein YcaP (DUF421 family)